MLHDGMLCDAIQSEGQGHRGPKVLKMADFEVYLLQRYACNYRVSTTPGNLLEFKNPPGNLFEFIWSSWKFFV